MSLTFFIELMIRLYLTSPLVHLIAHKTAMERAVSVGTEVGRFDPGPLKNCPRYGKIHGAFRRLHVGIAIGNMLCLTLTVLHLHYLASKLCVLWCNGREMSSYDWVLLSTFYCVFCSLMKNNLFLWLYRIIMDWKKCNIRKCDILK